MSPLEDGSRRSREAALWVVAGGVTGAAIAVLVVVALAVFGVGA